MKNKIIRKVLLRLIFVIPIVYGCGRKNSNPVKTISFNKNGFKTEKTLMSKDSQYFNCIDYYPNGKILNRYSQKNGEIDGLFTSYYLNGKIETEGKWLNGRKTGAFNYYDSLGTLQKIIKYIAFRDTSESKPNEIIYFNPHGDTLLDGRSLFYKIYSMGDTIKYGKDQYRLKLVLRGHIFENAFVKFCNFDENYRLPTKSDSCQALEMENFTLELAPRAYRLGENVIRGVIVNYEKDAVTKKMGKQVQIYFTDKFYVIP